MRIGHHRPPVLAAWGGGLDSTAMLVELVSRGEPVDQVLFADTGAEKLETYRFIPLFRRWLSERGVPSEVVRYQPARFKNWPPYRTLTENLLTNGTLPSIAFGRGTCSQKWKVAPQHAWARRWPAAQAAWARGQKVVKLIGFDCSRADDRRYAEAAKRDDPLYSHRYPLREWGWTREHCAARIEREDLPTPPKSACFFCTASRPSEVRDLPTAQLRQIVLIEARARPRLRTIEGLWRKAVAGRRGAEARPGSMTAFIRSEGLLPQDEVDAIEALAPDALVRWQGRAAERPAEQRPEMRQWLQLFDETAGQAWRLEAAPTLYDGVSDGAR
ncbi:MAG: hypothetical protein H2041_12165 [Phenylobacterium sp.]|uniref:hypothetical protein n=1 Tax=unclassified Phenylobacterium TaxID=2640670 RepID=UPI0008BEC7E3|nr:MULTISPECIES: hypothetical protein [unclassified Phenylobacterium]MBA4794412.1 hypothetical protein [Phenylobacterium sp.]OHB28615.1 MAG: hypothetical protein A2790_08620 [Phenylobacterium sp. RIFCSPHIGHO2_01_FULL_69_31]